MSLHLVTQDNQPYGSVRRCCERCGRATSSLIGVLGEAITDDLKRYSDSPLSCYKR